MSDEDMEDVWSRIRQEALAAQEKEPPLSVLFEKTVFAPGVDSFEDAVASTISYRLLLSGENSCFANVNDIIKWAIMNEDALELGHTMRDAVRRDALAVYDRDPACKTVLEVLLFFKGFAALVCHRAARRTWVQSPNSMVALFLQSQASAMFGVDIHPAATIGAGVMLDHGTGIVIGETAVVGDGCTLLHGVTLGGTGKESGDRHPKVGENVLIGANSSILGNIRIGDSSKIGAGSIVLRPIPPGATAVGAPAEIIGRAKESNPAATGDLALEGVQQFQLTTQSSALVVARKQKLDTTPSVTSTESSGGGHEDDSDELEEDVLCPYRDLRRAGRSNHSRDSITFDQMEKLLKAEGATTSQVGEMFFDMDRDCQGRVSLEDFEKKGASAVRRHSTIKHAEQVVQDHINVAKKKRIQVLGESMAQLGNTAMQKLHRITKGTGSNKAADSIEFVAACEDESPQETSEKIISKHLSRKRSDFS